MRIPSLRQTKEEREKKRRNTTRAVGKIQGHCCITGWGGVENKTKLAVGTLSKIKQTSSCNADKREGFFFNAKTRSPPVANEKEVETTRAWA